jgi:uncharacterized membrane protein YphA (DoxX/SURF4 family)
MHPLSLFPSLLTFGLLSPFLIRVVAGLYVLYLGKKRYAGAYKWTSILYVLAGIGVFLGFYTQAAAILAMCVVKFDFYLRYWKDRKTVPISKDTYFTYFLVQFIFLSLLFTGPGFLAFDLPL